MPDRGRGRPHFQEQMLELERSMLGALDMSRAQLDRVLDAMRDSDIRLAEFVIADDDRIDGRYLEVHQGVLSLLALQAPVAGDLRLVAAVLHAITSIERIGDQCANIAKLILLMQADVPPDDSVLERILVLGALARDQLGQARFAFAGRDVSMAESLEAQDDKLHRLDREIFKLAVQAGEDPALREWAISMTLVARALVRIGGSAVHIGEQAVFAATGHALEFDAIAEHQQP